MRRQEGMNKKIIKMMREIINCIELVNVDLELQSLANGIEALRLQTSVARPENP